MTTLQPVSSWCMLYLRRVLIATLGHETVESQADSAPMAAAAATR